MKDKKDITTTCSGRKKTTYNIKSTERKETEKMAKLARAISR